MSFNVFNKFILVLTTCFLSFSLIFLSIPLVTKAQQATFPVTLTKYVCPPGTIIPNIDPATNIALRPTNSGVTQGPLPLGCVPGSGYEFGLNNFGVIDTPLPGTTGLDGKLTVTVVAKPNQVSFYGISEYNAENLIGFLCNFELEQTSANASYVDNIEMFVTNTEPGFCNVFNILDTLQSSSSSISSSSSSSSLSSVTNSSSSHSQKSNSSITPKKLNLVRTGGQ
jgi:hypothetical protein